MNQKPKDTGRKENIGSEKIACQEKINGSKGITCREEIPDGRIQWHPAFCAAAELEFWENHEELEFHREYNLSKKPLQIDLLVVKKWENADMKNEIGRIFRKYNVIEYKSPGDGLNIDDLFKTVGYACLYKGTGETADEIPLHRLTVSLFRETYPRGLIRSLKKQGLTVERKFDGIYYVEGLFIPAQIVVIGELKGREHRSLKILSRNAAEEDIRGFVENARRLVGQGEIANADAVLQVSMSANYGLFDEMRRKSDMCEAMRRLMKDEIRQELEAAEKKTKQKMSLSLFGMGLPIEKIAEAAEESVQMVQQWLNAGVKAAGND